MRIKRILHVALFFMFISFLVGCATFSTVTTNRWIGHELAPSRINYTGNSFMEGRLSDGTIFHVYFNSATSNDATHYYNILMQDFGWHLTGDGWRGTVTTDGWGITRGPTRPRRGYMYINPSRQVAIYFFPGRATFEAFGVRLEN
jgi:hypothetical protein